jgi:hypothetical protein
MHWLSLVQVGPQVPSAQALTRQAEGLVQAAPWGAPHRPSPPHTPAAHCTARVQG